MLTIVTPATSTALTTVEAMREELGLDAADGLLGEFILRASAMVESLCGRSFARERVRETIRARLSGGPILPRRWPVAAIVALTIDGKAVDPVEVSFDEGMFERAGGWGREAVITYDAGYVLPGSAGRTLPYDIERVVVELVKTDWHNRDRDTSIRSEDVDGVSSMSFFGSGSTLAAITAPLAAYRLPVAL